MSGIVKKSICLNMIVKNESHIIIHTLKNLSNYINFDYWVISDTGSTDGTQELIKNYFKEKNINGELFQDEWRDFSHNRNRAMDHAFNKSDYIFFFDADDLITGNFNIPEILTKDVYVTKFRHFNTYFRYSLINNRKKFCSYIGVLHEYLNFNTIENSIENIEGEYFIESRRLGSRSKNENKYLDDAKILEKAYYDEKEDMKLKNRYLYYCAQSYFDHESYETAIKWYKIYLENNFCHDYKYWVCNDMGIIFKRLDNIKESLYYFAKAHDYDKERIEGIVNLMKYYYDLDLHYIVNMFWNKFKNYKIFNCYEKIFLNDIDYPWFEYLNIVSAFYCNDKKGGYESCKRSIKNDWNKIHVLNNLIYYSDELEKDNDNKIVIDFLFNNVCTDDKQFNKNIWKKYSFYIKKFDKLNWNKIKTIFEKDKIIKSKDYKKSKNILIYTGEMNINWNYSYMLNNALGGSEKAVAYLSKELAKEFNVFVSGDVEEENINNVTFINKTNLQKLLDETIFNTVIISRYICFFEKFNNIKCNKIICAIHDCYGFMCDLYSNDINIYENNKDYINKIICLTEWHKKSMINRFNLSNNKVEKINNGINIDEFIYPLNNKQKNKFIWSSCKDRGLVNLLRLWSDILKIFPDATLDICTYSNTICDDENEINNILEKYSDSIKFHGSLSTKDLYKLISISEYWLYTNPFNETSCITALEMLMNEVICLYYPLGGLLSTLGDYGLKVNDGNEIETLKSLTDEKKNKLKKIGKEYATNCSWSKRSEKWLKLIKE